MPEKQSLWELRLGVYTTERQAEALQEQIARLLCPDPDHTPPCPIPWSLSLAAESALEAPEIYTDLVEQSRIENEHRD